MQSKVYLFSLLFSLACLMWQCGSKKNEEVSPTPSISAFTPDMALIGANVTISGENFSTAIAENIVRFNGTVATVTAATATSITTTVPEGATTGKITVEVGGKTATSAGDFIVLAARNYTTVSTFVGSTPGNTLDGTGSAAVFQYVWGITKDSQGNFYVSDYVDNVIRKITPQGVVTTFAGTAGQAGDADGIGAAARFRIPTGLCVDASDNLYVGEAGGNRIRKITPQGVVTTFAGSTTAESGAANGTGTAARFWGIVGLSIDAQNNIYVADSNNSRIRKVTSEGVVSTVATNINQITDVFISPQNTLYASTGTAIYTVNTSTGATTLLAGNTDTSNGAGFVNGQGSTARFRGARVRAMDSVGNLYIADADNRSVRRIDADANVTTVAGNGTSGSTDGPIANATFGGIPALYIEFPSNIIYLTDISSGRVRKIE